MQPISSRWTTHALVWLAALSAPGCGSNSNPASSGLDDGGSSDSTTDEREAGAAARDMDGSRATADGSTGAGDASSVPGSGDASDDATTGRAGDGGSVSDDASSNAYQWKNVAIGGGGFVTGIVFSPAQSGLAYARTDVGGFYRWDDGSGQWTPLTDFFSMAQANYMGGESIAPDPSNAQVVYAAAGMYEASGNGVILRSPDQGRTWSLHSIPVTMGGNGLGRGMGERLAVDPNNGKILLFGSRSNGLFRSTDSAATWTQVTAFPTAGDATYGLPVVVFDKAGGTATGSTAIYVAAASKSASSNLYRSTDGGTTWGLVAGGPSGLMAHHASLGADGALWLTYSSDYGPYNVGGGTLMGQVWKLTTPNGTWTNVTPPAANWGGMAGGISVDAQNPLHAIVSTLDWYAPDRLLGTFDGGKTWTVIAQPPVSYAPSGSTYDDNGATYWMSASAFIGTGATNWVEAVSLDPFNPSHALYGTGAGVWSSSDLQDATGTSGQGVTWTFLDKGLEETVPIYLMPTIKGAFLGSIGDLGGMRNTDVDQYSSTGQYTNPLFSNTNGIDFAEANPTFVVRVGNSGVVASDTAYSNDNGQTWTPCATAPPGYATANQMQSVAVAADGTRFVVSPYAGHGSPAYTTNNGSTWTACAGLPSGALLASDRVTAGTFYATSGGTLYVSTDRGATFASANTFAGTGAPRAVFGQAGEVWVAAAGGKLYRFTGSGGTVTTIASVANAYGVGFGAPAHGETHPSVFVIGTVGGQYGFFRSDDGSGTTWKRINDDSHQYGGLQNDYIAGDEGRFGRVYLTTGGRGYVYGDGP